MTRPSDSRKRLLVPPKALRPIYEVPFTTQSYTENKAIRISDATKWTSSGAL